MEMLNVGSIINRVDFYHVVQPIVDLFNKRVHGYEFLLRSSQFSNPETLFAYANKQNRLIELDMNSFFKALELSEKQSKNLNGLYFYLNIFPSTLINPVFLKGLHEFLKKSGLKPDSIVLEISENQDGVDMSILKMVTEGLKSEGFMIALDDFGKAGSALKTALEIKPDITKIDRYFSKELASSSKKQEVIKFILQLFGNDTMIVLEGIESKEDYRTAVNLGVPFAQGFYLGEPKPLRFYVPNIK